MLEQVTEVKDGLWSVRPETLGEVNFPKDGTFDVAFEGEGRARGHKGILAHWLVIVGMYKHGCRQEMTALFWRRPGSHMININTKSFAYGLNNTHSLPPSGWSQSADLDAVTEHIVKREQSNQTNKDFFLLFFLTMQNKNNCCCWFLSEEHHK